jgi:hypothetical protein
VQNTLSDESRRELNALRASVRRAGLWDEDHFFAYPADQIDYNPEPESITPEVRVSRQVAWDTSNVHRVIEPGNPFATIIVGATRSVVADSDATVADRWAADEDQIAFSHRDEDEAKTLHRWDRAEDELELLDIIAERNLGVWNEEILLAFRRAQLRALLKQYFSETYAKDNPTIVLSWMQNARGRWVPALQMPVLDWIASLVHGGFDRKTWEPKGGSGLSGYTSAVATLRAKLAQTRKQDGTSRAVYARTLDPAEVREVVHQAVATLSSSALALYMEP